MSNGRSERDEFKTRVEALVEQVRSWVEPHGWITETYPKRMRDVDSQLFEVPALFIQKGPVPVLLDPVAYDVPGAQAVVDLYLMPTYDDMASLYLEQGTWMIRYPLPPDGGSTDSTMETQALPLGEESINQVLDSIATHAAPSF